MVTSRGGRLGLVEAERMLGGAASGIAPFVLAAGAEDYLRDRLVAAFRTGGEGEGSEFRRLEGDELDAATLEGALASLPLFGGAVRLWIRECSKLEKGAAESLLAWTRGLGEGVRVLATTAREVGELKLLESLAERAVVVPCTARPEERVRWTEAMAREAGLALPRGLAGAIAAAVPDLLTASQEIAKLASLADGTGRVPPEAADALRGAPLSGSLARWVEAALAGDLPAARAEGAALEGAGVGAGAALWSLAERALSSLEPGGGGPGFGAARRPPGGGLQPAAARRVLDAVYRVDRAIKRGEIRDDDWMDVLIPAVAGSTERT